MQNWKSTPITLWPVLLWKARWRHFSRLWSDPDLRSILISYAVGYSVKSYSISVTKVGRTLHYIFQKYFRTVSEGDTEENALKNTWQHYDTLQCWIVVQLLLWNGWNLDLNWLPSFQVDILIIRRVLDGSESRTSYSGISVKEMQ